MERPSLGMGFGEMALDSSIQLPPLQIDNSDGGIFPTAVGNARFGAAAGHGCWAGFSLIGSDGPGTASAVITGPSSSERTKC